MKTPAFVTLLALATSLTARSATLVSHWTMNNPSPYSNEIPGGPDMAWDSATRAPATFDANETRLETSFDATRSTRIAAVSSTLDIASFSFSMIIDPTDIIDFGAILQKESAAPDTFADHQRVAWQVQHTTAGTIEFIVRGTDPGTKDFYGAVSVSSATSGFSAGASFGDPATYFHIAGGYDATTGSAFLYVTELGEFALGGLTGSTATFDTGAVMDSSALSAGTAKSGSDYLGNGAGFDLADLQVYDGLLSASELLFLANNPGAVVPEPGAGWIGILGCTLLLRRRRI